jgi:hypothetical protein
LRDLVALGRVVSPARVRPDTVFLLVLLRFFVASIVVYLSYTADSLAARPG